MSETLTHTQIEAAGLADWRQLLGTIKARFKTANFATGLALVDRIGSAAEEADHHPEISLTYSEVLVTLSSHDVGGITQRDVDLARTISGYAAEAGAEADVAGLTQLEIGLDTAGGHRLAPFYAALLGGEVKDGEVVDASGQVPTLWWQEPHDLGPALPEPEAPQRWHFDVWAPADEARSRLQRVLDAGGTLLSDAAAPSYWVVADAEGNRSCICTVADRD